jgi:PhoH-like ATPase
MKKNYVLDTNVLLHDPHAIFKFEDNDLFLPIYVIEEVDQFKRDSNERGRNARTISRLLDGLRTKGPLSGGVSLDGGGSLRVFVPATRAELPIALNPGSGDHAILQTAIAIRDSHADAATIFVTMDVNLRIRGDALGLTTESYENQAVDFEHLESGIIELPITSAELDGFLSSGSIKPPEGEKLPPNVCVVLRDDGERPRTALARYHGDTGDIRALKVPREGLSGVRACRACARATASKPLRSICCWTRTCAC